MSTTTIRLPDDLKARVAAAAKRAGKTTQGFIVEAIAEKAKASERRDDFHEVAEKRYAAIAAAGKTIAWSEMRTYLEERVAGIGRPATGDMRELVIGRGSRGDGALYRDGAVLDTVFVLAVRSRREAGYKRDGGPASWTDVHAPNRRRVKSGGPGGADRGRASCTAYLCGAQARRECIPSPRMGDVRACLVRQGAIKVAPGTTTKTPHGAAIVFQGDMDESPAFAADQRSGRHGRR